jgi:hypothetical protein
MSIRPPLSEATKRKISQTKRGRRMAPPTEETKSKISWALLGHRNAAVLTPELVKSIRAEHIKGDREHGSSAIARRLGVSSRCIVSVVNGATWNDLPERPSPARASVVRPVGVVSGPPDPRGGAVTLGAGQVYYPLE